MLARGGVVILTIVILLAVDDWVEARAVPHHRRRQSTRLLNVTLNNTTLLPAMVPGNELILEGYRMDRFGKDLFDMLSRTGSLILRKGSIQNVYFHSETLDTLQIQSTELESFDLDARPFPNLRVLHITHNPLEAITPRIGYLVGLRQLDLTQNHLTHVQLELFEPMRHLRDLNLSLNRIVRIEPSTTAALDRQELTVRNLWLGYNRLETLDVFPDAFPALTTVRLYGNAWTCPWVDRARAEIQRKGITVFGADYDCTGDRRGGLCCYEKLSVPIAQPPIVNIPTPHVNYETNGTIAVQYGQVEIVF